ncbi:hypothetical protein DXG03_005338 [Asterophora parasitica]|uniref:WIBG Mago-binding domain-containing protein n=1 Tax=Asterophora parasitica TaxID=117018 RepID=A0A9P7FZJ6_9AGAR|nr:hypothetical protein DXG03_005338 [Asterophora parasitica]
MSRPPINPDKTVAGIALDPQTLERVIPESRRPDGTVRKQIKIRPGFTPQEDVRKFRGTRQAQMDANALPKGHIIGWAPPPQSTAAASGSAKPLSKAAKKNAKRREKKAEQASVPDDWEDDDEEAKAGETGETAAKAEPKPASSSTATTKPSGSGDAHVEELSSKLGKLGVK